MTSRNGKESIKNLTHFLRDASGPSGLVSGSCWLFFSGGSVIVWKSISISGIGDLQILIHHAIQSEKYLIGKDYSGIFCRNNDPKHIKTYFDRKKIPIKKPHKKRGVAKYCPVLMHMYYVDFCNYFYCHIIELSLLH